MSSSHSSTDSVHPSGYRPITLEGLGELHPIQAQRYRFLSRVEGWFDLGELYTSATLAKIVADYVQEAIVFGPRDYRTAYGVDVGDAVFPEEDRIWWNSLDAITPFDSQDNPIYNYETHHGFHYIPANCKPLTERVAHLLGVHVGEEIAMDIENYDLLAAELEVGGPSRFRDESESLCQNKKIRSATSCWVAQRKQVLFRNETTVKQRALMQELNTETEVQMQAMSDRLGVRYGTLTGTRYENLPDLRDLSIIASNHLAKTRERILGDSTGFEGRWTGSRTQQQVTFEDKNEQGVVVGRRTHQVEVGYQAPLVTRGVEGPCSSGGLCVYSYIFDDESIGVAGLRKSLVIGL